MGALTTSIMTLSIMTLKIMTLNITTLSITQNFMAPIFLRSLHVLVLYQICDAFLAHDIFEEKTIYI
jgi:hypothetical protein